MYTIVGEGFGLYGYLPALVSGIGETVLLPRSYECRVLARPELAGTLAGIRWVANSESALAAADAVVIATPPLAQVEMVKRCAKLANIRRFVLEKPVASSPELATSLLDSLDDQGKRYRVGYTLLHARWHSSLCWPQLSMSAAPVRLEWTFHAHHFAHNLFNWKRRHEEGGGVLRFFGIHVVALLASQGYDSVLYSFLNGANASEPERWRAMFAGPGLPHCEVLLDSRCNRRGFSIGQVGKQSLVALVDPFEAVRVVGHSDPRVEVL
ncbi:MAG: hypothetical protein EBZ36_17535, partial [Acidobacteria bacterium]|nr:hypothetical protein [Acidobacteriota bacterium]